MCLDYSRDLNDSSAEEEVVCKEMTIMMILCSAEGDGVNVQPNFAII